MDPGHNSEYYKEGFECGYNAAGEHVTPSTQTDGCDRVRFPLGKVPSTVDEVAEYNAGIDDGYTALEEDSIAMTY